jgi:ribosome-binding factor A
MGSIRQSRIESIIQKAVGTHLQRNAREVCLGAMVTVTTVRVTADLSIARIFVSILSTKDDRQKVLDHINEQVGKIRYDVGKELKNLHKIPELQFRIDDSLDYAMEIDRLLKE